MSNVLSHDETRAEPGSDRRSACQTQVAAAVAGDREAFAELYRIYAPAVRAYIWRRCRDRELVDDLASETFTRALVRIPHFTWTGTDIGAWLVTIARNLVADYYRSAKRSEQPVATWTGWDIVDGDPAVDPYISASRAELGRQLQRVLGQLGSSGQEECLRLRFLEEYSVGETAAKLGLGVDACKALQHRAVRSANRLLGAAARRAVADPAAAAPQR